ncbi:MAG TPA: ABC transporter permease [Rugosimonospora sp.]|jgi:ABC-2 type transport system permease protein
MNLTIAGITARGLFGRRRFLLLFPLPVLLLVLTVAAKSTGVDPEHWAPSVIDGMGFAVMLPVIALIVGTGVLGSEIDDGTVVHILAKPLPRHQIIVAKLVVAAGITALTSAVPMFIVGVLVDSARFGVALAVACLVAALGYSGVFLAMSLVTRRPVLVGLLYVLIWEALLGNVLTGTRVLSIHQYALSVTHAIAPNDLIKAHVGLPAALAMSAVFLVGGALLAIDRLRSFSVAGETS